MVSQASLLRHDSDESDDGRTLTTASASASGGRMQELLASYYGMQRGVDRSSDVESTNFDAKSYVRGLLQKDKVETLLRKDDEMVREVKKLDSDMQMLVYENYNKFISATDTIRKMAQNVEGMETEMADLKSSMDPISESSAKINASLKGNRSKMDKLVRVRRLLQRLDFLFQLPQKLEEAVLEGQYAKAIRYFSMTKDILRKHSHVSSFGAIQRECEETITRLQDKLQNEVDSPDVSRDTLVSHADLLLRLGVDPAGLKDRYLEAHRRQLHAFLSASKGALVEDRSVSLDACLGKLAEGFLPMLLRTVQIFTQLFQQNASEPSPPSNGNPHDTMAIDDKRTMSPTTASAKSPAGASNNNSTGAVNNSGGIRRGEGVTFISNGNASAGSGSAGDEPAATASVAAPVASGARVEEQSAELVALTQSSVDSFFKLLYAKVDQSLDAEPRSREPSGISAVGGTVSGSGKAEDQGVAGESGLDPVALGGVVAAVQQLVSDIETVDPHVPQAHLTQRAKEFAQEFKRGQVRRSFRVLCRSSLAMVTSLVAAVRSGTPAEDLLANTPETASSDYWSGAGVSGGRSGGRRRRVGGAGGGGLAGGQQYPALVERALETLLKGADGVVSSARPLSRLDASPGPLLEDLRFGLWGVVLWFASVLGIIAGSSPDASAETLPSAEGRENNAAVEEEWGARAVAALKEPLPDARYASLSSSSSSSSSSSPLPSSADIVIDTDGGVADGRGGGGGDEGVGDSGAGAREGATDGELTLLLACLCRGLGTTFVVRLPEILNRQLPPTLDQSVHATPAHLSSSVHSTRSASTLYSAVTDRSLEGDEDSALGGVGGVLERRRQLEAVRNRVSAASLGILEHYAVTTGRRMADTLQAGLDGPPGGGDWFSAEEPVGVGGAVLDSLELAEDNVKEVCAFLGEARSGTVSVTRSGDRDLRRGSSVALLGGRTGGVVSGYGGSGGSGGGGGGGVRRDIDRIFESGASGSGSRGSSSDAARVSFAADAMLAAVFRVALKVFGERARSLTLPGPGFRQVQLDADFLRQILPFYVAESQMLASLDRLLDQALQVAADRSLDPTLMDASAAGDIVAQALDGFK